MKKQINPNIKAHFIEVCFTCSYYSPCARFRSRWRNGTRPSLGNHRSGPLLWPFLRRPIPSKSTTSVCPPARQRRRLPAAARSHGNPDPINLRPVMPSRQLSAPTTCFTSPAARLRTWCRPCTTRSRGMTTRPILGATSPRCRSLWARPLSAPGTARSTSPGASLAVAT